jgi:predicted tellurium resistance membrane protein TerC
MADLFSLENLMTLAMLTLLQAVLGFDNLLYISIESKRVAPDRQSFVRKTGIGLAILLRIALLFAVVQAIGYLQEPFFSLAAAGLVEGAFNLHSVIVLLGGVFIIYTAVKEIHHMLALDELGAGDGQASRSTGAALFWIVAMNLVFSFDSILAAVALTDAFWVMATAVVISGGLMIWLADHVAEFLKRNRMFEVLGLFILLIVGMMLLSEGGHLAHLRLFGFAIEPMAKSTFYLVIFVLVAVDLVQSRYRKKLMRQRAMETGR